MSRTDVLSARNHVILATEMGYSTEVRLFAFIGSTVTLQISTYHHNTNTYPREFLIDVKVERSFYIRTQTGACEVFLSKPDIRKFEISMDWDDLLDR